MVKFRVLNKFSIYYQTIKYFYIMYQTMDNDTPKKPSFHALYEEN